MRGRRSGTEVQQTCAPQGPGTRLSSIAYRYVDPLSPFLVFLDFGTSSLKIVGKAFSVIFDADERKTHSCPHLSQLERSEIDCE